MGSLWGGGLCSGDGVSVQGGGLSQGKGVSVYRGSLSRRFLSGWSLSTVCVRGSVQGEGVSVQGRGSLSRERGSLGRGLCSLSLSKGVGLCSGREVSVQGRGSLSRGWGLSGEGVSVQGSLGISVQRRGGLCPGSLCSEGVSLSSKGISVQGRGCLSREEVCVQGDLCSAVSVQGRGSLQGRGCLSRGWGLCRGRGYQSRVSLSRGVCPQAISVNWRSLSRRVSIQVVSVWGSQSRAWGSLFRGVSVQRKEVSV